MSNVVVTDTAPRLKLAVILPILMVCIYLPLELWQSHVEAQQPPQHERALISHVTSAYLGLNAPARLFEVLCEEMLPIYRIDHTPPTLLGIGAGRLLFFTGVVVLWSSVGLFIDRHRDCRMPHTATSVWRILGTLSLLGLAMLHFGGGVFVIRHRPAGIPVGDFLQGISCFGWSLVFAVASVMRHVTAFSPNPFKHGT